MNGQENKRPRTPLDDQKNMTSRTPCCPQCYGTEYAKAYPLHATAYSCSNPSCQCHAAPVEEAYNRRDHIHCFDRKNPPCGQKIEHLKCCLCEMLNPIVTSHGEREYAAGKKSYEIERCVKCNSPFEQHHHRHVTRKGTFHTGCYLYDVDKRKQVVEEARHAVLDEIKERIDKIPRDLHCENAINEFFVYKIIDSLRTDTKDV